MHNRQNKTALNTSREQFREPKLGVCISQLLSVHKDSKRHLSLHGWAGSQLEPINSKHQAQALCPSLTVWNAAVPLLVLLCSSQLTEDPCQAKVSPELPTAWNSFCPSSLVRGGYRRIGRWGFHGGNTPLSPCLVQTTIKLGNIRLGLGEWQLERVWCLPRVLCSY